MGLQEFYESAHMELLKMTESQGVRIPTGVCAELTEEDFDRLYSATIMHDKPLTNALGPGFKEVLTKKKVVDIFSTM